MGSEYNRTLDKPVASLSCAILGSQHNWDLGWQFSYKKKKNNILIFTIVNYDSNIIIHVYRIWKQSIKYFIFSYTVQCSLKSLLTHRIVNNTNDVESLTEYIIT